MRREEEVEEEPKWWDRNQELSLPTQEELIPISQTLIPTDLALAFDIISTDPNNNNSKRPRLVWTPHLHRRFVDSVAQLGIKNAVPKAIMQLMGVDGLTRENVASHLQKYRQYLKRIGSGLGGGGGDPAMDRLFSSSPVPALFLQQTGCVKAVGTVGELVFRPEGYRGVGENGSVLDRNLDRSFQMGQSQQSSSDKRDNLSPFSAVGKVQDLRIGKEGYRRVAENGSDRLLDRSFQMGQSQQSCSDKQDNLSPFSAVGMVQDLRIGKEGYRRVAENGSGSDRLLDRSFQMGQSQQSCSDKQDNLSPFSAVGRVQELGFGTKGFRGVGENGSVSNLVSERLFLMGQFQQSNSNDQQKMWPLSAVGSIREVGFGTKGFQGVGENGLVSNLSYDRSFMMGQSQQSSTNRDNLSPFSAVGMVQELGFRGVGGNGSVSNLVSERSFFMGQSQQSNTNRENLSPFPAVGPVQELGFRGMGANGSGSNGLFDRSLQMGRFQMYGSSPLYVDEMASGDSGGGRRVLTLFPTREEN